MAEIQTHQELRERAIAAALLLTTRLSEESFQPGYVADAILGASAALAEECQRISAQNHLDTFIRTAAGQALDDLASDHFEIERRDAAAAVVTVEFTRPSAAPGPVLIEAGTIVSTVTGEQFVLTTEPLLTGTSIEAEARAAVTGPDGNVAASTITQIVTTLPDATITVDNPQQAAGGANAETDDAFRERLFRFWPTFRRGTAEAIVTGALSVAGVFTATINEATSPATVYIADVDGGSNDALVAAVLAELDNWRALGVPISVVGAAVLNQAIDAALIFEDGFDTVANRSAVKQALSLQVKELGTGETLYRSALAAAAHEAVGALVDIDITTPSGNVTPSANQLLRATESGITLT